MRRTIRTLCPLLIALGSVPALVVGQTGLDNGASETVAKPIPATRIDPGKWIRRHDLQPDGAMALKEYDIRQEKQIAFKETGEGTPAPLVDGTGVDLTLNPGPENPLAHDLVDGVHWARGLNYKARIGDDGFAYIPFLGSDAPRSYPLQMQLTQVTIGGDPIEFESRAHVSRNGDRVTLDRGSVQVHYDLALDSAEQSFVLDAAGSEGDLQLTIAVETELMSSEIADGIAYSNELGVVHYEHAVVIDGLGQRLAIPIGMEQGRIRLVVPSEYLTTAQNPITVDPTISLFTVNGTNTVDQFHPDVAYDLSNDRFAFVVHSVFSAMDNDVRIETYSSLGAFIDAAWVDMTTDSWKLPAIANDNASDTFLVVAQVGTVFDEDEVYGRSVYAPNLAMSPQFLIGFSTTAYENSHVDVGGKSQGSSLFKVVWERRFLNFGVSAIRSRTVTPLNPHSTVTPPVVSGLEGVSEDFSTNFTRPAISKSSGKSGNAEWRVAFAAQITASQAESVHSARYADDNTLLSAHAPLFTIPAPTFDLLGLDVSEGLVDVPGPINGEPTYVIVAEFSGTNGRQIWWYGMDGDNYFDVTHLGTPEHRQYEAGQLEPSIAATEDNFVITYGEWVPDTFSFIVNQSRIDLVNTGNFGVSDRRLRLGDTEFISSHPTACASRFSGGMYSSRRVASVFDGYDDPGPFTTRAQITSVTPAPLAGYQYCTGNPNSTGDYGFIAAYGTPDVGTLKTLNASALPLNQFGYFLSGQGGFGVIAVPGSAGIHCMIGGPLGRYNQPTEVFNTATTGTATLAIDPAAFRGPGGPVVASAGETWNFQVWHRESGGSSNFTNGVSILLE